MFQLLRIWIEIGSQSLERLILALLRTDNVRFTKSVCCRLGNLGPDFELILDAQESLINLELKLGLPLVLVILNTAECVVDCVI